jgi:NADPH:quinone reductase-like Zn-dependent oxidoreductase
MYVVEAPDYGPPEVLRLTTRPEPEPTPGRVRVRVAAATVNPADAGTRAGAFAWRLPDLPKPFVLGWDFAGTVLDDAGGFRAGERVAGMIPWFALGTGEGAAADIVSADPSWLGRVPAGLDDVVAATVPLNGLTARQAVEVLAIGPGAVVAVTGASGAVGGFATQLLAAAGAHVIAVASRGDEAYVASLGAKDVVTRTPDADLSAAIREVAPAAGVDAVFDPGSAGAGLLAVIRDGGVHVASTAPLPDPGRGIRMARVEVEPDAAQLQSLLDDVGAGRLQTRVAATLPFGDAAEAHRRVEAGGLRGKIVLVPAT